MRGRKAFFSTSIFTLLFLGIFLTTNTRIYAQPSVEIDEKECNVGEQKASCTYSSAIMFGYDSCKKYSLNPRFTFLESVGTDVVRNIYCYHPLTTGQLLDSYTELISGFVTNTLSVVILLTILLELPVFFALGFRTKKHLINVVFINFISVPLVNLTLLLLHYRGFIILGFLAIFVVMLESATLVMLNGKFDVRKIVKAAIFANALSFVIVQILLRSFY